MNSSDRELLTQFLEGDRSSALEELFKRDSPLVWGICLRVLKNEHDAEDSLQAVLLVFINKVSNIRNSLDLSSWYYGVALRCASRLKRNLSVRHRHETEIDLMKHEEAVVSTSGTNPHEYWEVIWPVFDEELGELSEIYRMPLVHCYLNGQSYGQAAQRMVISFDALKKRLKRGRELLRKRRWTPKPQNLDQKLSFKRGREGCNKP